MPEKKEAHHEQSPTGKRLGVLTLTALGVVYGDIGTSPLYALRESFHGEFAMELTRANVFGVLSLMIWSLLLVISLKYLLVVMRADNDGEGGILALMELVTPEKEPFSSGDEGQGEDEGEDEGSEGNSREGDESEPESAFPGVVQKGWWVVAVGLFGAALLYGDGMITPAISVLSAVEGLKVATPAFEPYVIPITIVILIGLFVLQSRGTHGVGVIFGPIMLLWFTTLGVLGVSGIIDNPDVLRAFNPTHAVDFFGRHGLAGVVVLGAVFLVVTGGEALYADMGHLGPRPIRVGWFGLVLPGLLLNYLGQGALLIQSPETATNPFYNLAPEWALYPMVVLATSATIIASQAVISGSFSLTLQAVQFGFLPRMRIRHTSEARYGQIYVPVVNWMLLGATVGLVLGFQSSSGLAAAYGVAVTLTMIITDILLYRVMHGLWKWIVPIALTVTVVFLAVDLAYFSANALKIVSGGWFPIVVALLIYLLMSTWRKGRRVLQEQVRQQLLPFEDFLDEIGLTGELEAEEAEEVEVERELDIKRTTGSVVYLTGTPSGVPPALVQNFRHNRAIHEKVVFLTVVTDPSHARRELDEELRVEDLGNGFYRVVSHLGFMDEPDVPAILREAREKGLDIDPELTSYMLERETLVPEEGTGMSIWRDKLFRFMSRNSRRADAYFKLPEGRVLEIGSQVRV